MMEVEQQSERLSLNAPAILTTLLNDFSAVTDYRKLRDSLPRRLANLLKCRCVLLYQRVGETLQFASGTFDDVPGWSAALLSVAHINPIDLGSELPEARAWRSRHATTSPFESSTPALVAVPLIYRQHTTGVLVVFRNAGGAQFIAPKTPAEAASWSSGDLPVLEAVASVIALLLENTRLLERDRERINELSLLNSIARQLNSSMYEPERVHSIVIQRTREITDADLCELIRPDPATQFPSWITPALYDLLLSRFNKQRESHFMPLIIERPGDAHTMEYLKHLPSHIKTFFAIPLFVSEAALHRYGDLASTTLRGRRIADDGMERMGAHLKRAPQEIFSQKKVGDKSRQGARQVLDGRGANVLGIVVGAYHRARKLRREELVLLQVLASQSSAVLENMQLVTEVVEARNEARKLLRQVLDDQRLKELILESVPSGLITVNLSGRITTFNRAAAAILDYHPYEVLGQPLQKILNLQIPEGTVQGEESQHTHTTSDEESGVTCAAPTSSHSLVTVDRHGQEVALDVHIVALCNDQREQIGWLATFTDVSLMRRLEEEKRRLDRLASLGEMAASVAHEVRNPLASIKTSMQMLMDDLAGDTKEQLEKDQGFEYISEGIQESVLVALKEVERLDAIVRDLLLFARPRRLHRVACDLIDLSEHVLNIMQAQCAEMGIVVHRVYHEIPPVPVDMAQIEQVLFNLYINAVQAMPEGGVLTVSCTTARGSGQREKGRAFAEPVGSIARGKFDIEQGWLELAVSDTGVGIASDQLEHIFQPFFTTKAHGIGLGLSITRRLVEDHGGHLLVESQPGYGTTISVRLPIVNTETL